MKILGITALILLPLTAFSFWMDYLQGFNLQTSLQNVTSAFRVMDIMEMIVMSAFLLILLIQLLYSWYQKKKGNSKVRKAH
ncbi:hypothetical protein [Bacillus thermotolerans]|uniref:hypothetical protein n=1 Tax=Bacillus thermotolerans TaxID=1221996 RepID=UPI0005894621|nr:hypothetical protein [Bacillus thermotolerans]KKB42669.1 hypothetical protein QY96_01311 [Bacillus thermotolerans]